MKFSVYQTSRRGGRPLNEDRLGYSYTRQAVLLVLADGMGGHPEGEKAAEIAVEVFSREFLRNAKPTLPDMAGFLKQTLLAASAEILAYAARHAMSDSPRTTLVAAVLQDGRVSYIHSGDSRLYWVRRGRVLQRTRDHSYQENAELLRPAGAMAANRNILFTCLGSPTSPIYDVVQPLPVHAGDRLLLCSDGLWSVLDDELIAEGLCAGPLEDVIPRLTDIALKNGGRRGDNVSLLALEWAVEDEFEPTHVIDADEVSDDGFASTFQSGHAEQMLEDFDDEAIERSIAEINEAIRRSSERKGR